ncbi:hypothetical protein CC79DRAFT_1370400 [Sarocladium strictum]
MEAPPVDRELWAEYAVGALFIIARFAVRAKVIGVKNFGLEDLLTARPVVTFFTEPKRAIRYFCVTTTSNDTNTAAATPGTEAAPGTGGQGGPPSSVEDDKLVAGIKER